MKFTEGWCKMEVKQVNINEITPYEKNPRKNAAAVDKVAESIKEFGFKQPIVVDAAGVIIVGHTRYKAAQKLGITEVPVLYARDLTDAQVKAYRLADNKTNEYADWDFELLGEEFLELKDAGYDLNMTAFDPSEINQILKGEVTEDNFDVDEAVKAIKVPKSKPGDVYLLGAHRLVCGDSTKQSDVDLLMDGARADMIFTDPPYNVNYEGGTGLKIQNDSMDDSKFYQFLYDAYVSMFNTAKAGAPIYVCHADSEGVNFRKAMKDAGWELKQCIIWVKNSLVMGRQDHHWQHEPILYGWKPGKSHKWYGGRKHSTVIKPEQGININKTADGYQLSLTNGLEQLVVKIPSYEIVDLTDSSGTSIWNVDKPKKNGEHPTMKPLKLVAKAINNSSKDGDIVVDLFGGSGSTLMACDQLGRKCYTMELDPIYVDVIIQRWEEFTNKKAVRL
jgi:DNA modification methylase